MVCAGIAAVTLFPLGIIALVLGGIASGVTYHFMAGKYGKAYIKAYKQTVIEKLVTLIRFQPPLQPGTRHRFQLLRSKRTVHLQPDRYKTEDLIYGDYGKTSVFLGELHAEDRRTSRDSKGNTKTTYVTIFKGLMLIADFHKHFEGRTFVFPDIAEKTFGGFGRALQKMSGRRGTSLVQMEDTEFEQAFAVHSTDQVEARYILSPALMRRMLEMKNRFGKDVRIAFKESSDSAIVAAAMLSDRYISDRFLPDKAVDLIDEAASRLKIELDSMPTEIDQLERQAMQLEMERQALTKETDGASIERLKKVELEIRQSARTNRWPQSSMAKRKDRDRSG
ncbi:Chaperone protein ClpB [Nymphon striatum]|nr:Chaperone protein ClpB [Nymphon striatum]